MIAGLRGLKAKQLARALRKDGFKMTSRKGGHRVYRHSDGRRAVLSFHHGGDTFPFKTLKAMIADAGWSEEDLRRLGLMK